MKLYSHLLHLLISLLIKSLFPFLFYFIFFIILQRTHGSLERWLPILSHFNLLMYHHQVTGIIGSISWCKLSRFAVCKLQSTWHQPTPKRTEALRAGSVRWVGISLSLLFYFFLRFSAAPHCCHCTGNTEIIHRQPLLKVSFLKNI